MSSLTSAKFKLSGMHCSACALNIEFDLEDLPGVHSVNTSYARQECSVEFDTSKISADGIIDQIRQTGYEAQKVS